MLKRILVPLDGSALAEQALSYAAELSLPTGATLLLLRAAYSHTMPGVDGRERKGGAIEEAERYVTEAAEELVARGYACQTLVPYGRPSDSIAEEARVAQADLIVMSTHGRSGVGRLVFGSVAESVVAHSSVPVLVTRAWLPPQRRPFLPENPVFLVPLDGSAFAETALTTAATLAEDFGAAMVLVRAEAPEGPVDEALAYVLDAQARLTQRFPGLSVMTDVRQASPAHAIETAYHDLGASLVVMATHGRGGVARSVAGSVAGKVLKQGRAPLVLVRPLAYADEPRLEPVAAVAQAR